MKKKQVEQAKSSKSVKLIEDVKPSEPVVERANKPALSKKTTILSSYHRESILSHQTLTNY